MRKLTANSHGFDRRSRSLVNFCGISLRRAPKTLKKGRSLATKIWAYINDGSGGQWKIMEVPEKKRLKLIVSMTVVLLHRLLSCCFAHLMIKLGWPHPGHDSSLGYRLVLIVLMHPPVLFLLAGTPCGSGVPTIQLLPLSTGKVTSGVHHGQTYLHAASEEQNVIGSALVLGSAAPVRGVAWCAKQNGCNNAEPANVNPGLINRLSSTSQDVRINKFGRPKLIQLNDVAKRQSEIVGDGKNITNKPMREIRNSMHQQPGPGISFQQWGLFTKSSLMIVVTL